MPDGLTRQTIQALMEFLGREVPEPARVYFVGGISAVLEGWRETTLDADIKLVPDHLVERVIPRAKEMLGIPIETAALDRFVPEVPGWEARSPHVATMGVVAFFHFDFYSQALAKIERGFSRDAVDVRAMLQRGLITAAEVRRLFAAIEPLLGRYPAIDPPSFRRAMEAALADSLT